MAEHTIVTPETWYRIYWTLMGVGFLVLNTIATAHAVRWGVVMAAKQLGWSK